VWTVGGAGGFPAAQCCFALLSLANKFTLINEKLASQFDLSTTAYNITCILSFFPFTLFSSFLVLVRIPSLCRAPGGECASLLATYIHRHLKVVFWVATLMLDEMEEELFCE